MPMMPARKPLKNPEGVNLPDYAQIVRESLIKKLKAKATDLKDKRIFQWAITNAVVHGGLTTAEISEEFDVTIETACRWVNGTRAPHQGFRAYILGKVVERLESKSEKH